MSVRAGRGRRFPGDHTRFGDEVSFIVFTKGARGSRKGGGIGHGRGVEGQGGGRRSACGEWCAGPEVVYGYGVWLNPGLMARAPVDRRGGSGKGKPDDVRLGFKPVKAFNPGILSG